METIEIIVNNYTAEQIDNLAKALKKQTYYKVAKSELVITGYQTQKGGAFEKYEEKMYNTSVNKTNFEIYKKELVRKQENDSALSKIGCIVEGDEYFDLRDKMRKRFGKFENAQLKVRIEAELTPKGEKSLQELKDVQVRAKERTLYPKIENLIEVIEKGVITTYQKMPSGYKYAVSYTEGKYDGKKITWKRDSKF